MLKGIIPLAASVTCLLAAPLFAQNDGEKPFKDNVFIGGGVAVPGGDLRQYMTPSAVLQFGYGYRPWKHFQADVSLTVIPRAAGISLPLQTTVGTFEVKDTEFILPFGGRAILPLLRRRIELFGGGGGAYLHYTEIAPTRQDYGCYPSACVFDVACPFCVSRGGWGGYGTAGADVMLDHRRRVWLGMETRFVKGTTSGELLGSGGTVKTKDQWLNVAMNVAFRF